MARTTIMTVSTRDLASRGAVLTVSALAHVLVYGALSLVPASTPPPRTGLLVAELIVSEPPTPPAREPITPPRPVMTPKPPAKPVETATPAKPTPAPQAPTQLEHPIEQQAPAPPLDAAARSAESAETPREVTTAPPPMITAPSSAPTTVSAPDSAAASAASPRTAPVRGNSAAVVAALPPGSAAVTSVITRTAIPRGGYQVTPSYPATARRLGIEGTALLRVFVDATGHVADIVVKQSAGHPDLDRAAADAVRRWRFDPARRGTDAVAMWVELPVEFHLR
jgi:periplasmic protein TonB